ncbi:CHAP domain-containing protein, partial [Oscillospiraceae bacterium OttesenSCG-928-G22]|nr:CHAP domain-containing protein [Oscillospiraceae bacterium OttesenSCG-928-G22]
KRHAAQKTRTAGGRFYAMTEKELRQKIVNTAAGYLGCKERDGSHRKIIDLYNSHKPLARGYAVKYTDAWCSTFVSAVAIACGMTDIIPTECGCEPHIRLFKSHAKSKWQEDGTITPQPGDCMFYNWDDSTQPNTGRADHVGIVEKVSGGKITVIEGNYLDSVKRRIVPIGHGYIRGYGLPDYAGKATASGEAEGSGGRTAEIHIVRIGDTLSKIAAAHGATADKLAKINGIENKNSIRVGQVIMLTGTAKAAAEKLAALGVISSPDYWISTAAAGTVRYLEDLLVKSAAKISKTGTRTKTVEEGVAALLTAGVMNSPQYWLTQYKTLQHLGDLLCALGGAVQ